MKVILLQDVKSLGKKDEIVEVSDGYARNFILPKKLGMEANAANLNTLKLQKANEAKVAQEIYEKALAQKEEVEKGKVVLTIKAGENGRTFGSISAKEIAEAAASQMKMELDKKKITLPIPIKCAGEFHVDVKLHTKVTASLLVIVEEK